MRLHTFFLKPIPIIKLIIRSASSFLLTTDTLTFVHLVQVVSLQETEPCVLDLHGKSGEDRTENMMECDFMFSSLVLK